MSDDAQNGQPPGGPQGPSEVEVAQMGAVQMIGSLVKAFAPELPDERAMEIALLELQQQEGLGTILSDAVDTDKRASHPRFGFRIMDVRSGTPEFVAEVNAPKDLAKATSIAELKHGIDIIAFATSPAARAVLHSFGYAIEFFQKKDNLITMPSTKH